MLKTSFFATLMCLIALPVKSDVIKFNYFLNCESAEFNLTFEVNTVLRSVRNVNFNTDMDIGYWSQDSINTSFSINKSLSQIISDSEVTDNVSINFDRLTGTAKISGIIAPTTEQIYQCETERNWGCDSWFVTSTFHAKCSIVEPQF